MSFLERAQSDRLLRSSQDVLLKFARPTFVHWYHNGSDICLAVLQSGCREKFGRQGWVFPAHAAGSSTTKEWYAHCFDIWQRAAINV